MALELRPVETRDIEEVLHLAKAMHDESPRYRVRNFSEEKARRIIEHLIATYGGYIAVLSGKIVGMVGGIIIEHFFGEDKYCSDLVVYVVPEWRGSGIFIKLIRLFEEWAFKNGAVEIVLGVSTGIEREDMVRVYERLGYTITSTSLIKNRVE